MQGRSKDWFEKNWKLLDTVVYTPKEVYEIVLSEKIDNIRIDNIVLDLESRKKGLASICYKQYSYINPDGHNSAYVVKESLNVAKLPLIKSILKIVANEYRIGSKPRTIATLVLAMNQFIVFCGDTPVLTDLENIRNNFQIYVGYLKEQIRIYVPQNKNTGERGQGISITTAQARQRSTKILLCEYADIDERVLTEGMRLIKYSSASKMKVQPVTNNELAQEFNFYTLLFRNLTRIILDHDALPQKIKYIEHVQWVMPHKTWTIPGKSCPSERKTNFGINYNDGNYYAKEYLQNKLGITSYDASKIILKNIKNSHKNNQVYSSVRKNLAIAACKAYFMHFLIITGMNDSTAASLLYDSDYEITKNSQNFKTIKWRAASKEVSFSIQAEFIDDFKNYIKLRNYILKKEKSCQFNELFIGKLQYGVTGQIKNGAANIQIRTKLSRIAPFPLNPSRELRVTKGLWVRKSYGVTVSAYVLQHSTSTAMTNYSGNDKNTTSHEMTNYFDWLNNKIINDKQDAIPTSTGNCAGNLKSVFVEQTPSLFKICGKGEGCLFCEHYRLHADETDLRKLYSLYFLIEQCRDIASNKVHFENVYAPVIRRIDSLLFELIKQKPALQHLIESIKKSVFEDEELTPFWSTKLETLIDLGVL
jgi:hypothetical protein